MDKLRVLKHYFLQEVTATLLNSVGDSLFTMSDHLAQILAGFSDPRHIIVQELNVTPDVTLAVKAGLQGCFIYRQTNEDAIFGVYKGTRPDQLSPYVEESLAIATADPTNPRIDILEAEIVQEDDPDYFDTVFIFNNLTETSGPEQKYTKRVRNVKLYIKTGTPAPSPVAPAATAGRFTLREITVPALAVTISPVDIVAQAAPPAPSPWTFAHPVVIYPSIIYLMDNAVYISGDQSIGGVKTFSAPPRSLIPATEPDELIRYSEYNNQVIIARRWKVVQAPSNNQIESLAYGNGVVIGVGGGGYIVRSVDHGETWTLISSPVSVNWSSVSFGNGVFVAVANTFTNNIMRSTDNGLTWLASTAPVASASWSSITYGNNVFVAVSSDGATHRVIRSIDFGVSWTAIATPILNTWRSIAFGNNTFVAAITSGSSDEILQSTDFGLTWVAHTIGTAFSGISSISFANGFFYISKNGGFENLLFESADGLFSNYINTPSMSGMPQIRKIVGSASLLVGVMSTGNTIPPVLGVLISDLDIYNFYFTFTPSILARDAIYTGVRFIIAGRGNGTRTIMIS